MILNLLVDLKLRWGQKCFEPLEIAFFNVSQIFEWSSWNGLLEKRSKALKAV